jgi:hypothetical protein
MKKDGVSRAILAPEADGWRINFPGGATQSAKTLGEAAAAVPPGAAIHLALPAHAALLERLTLPSTNREELAGMVQLQLEKTLPYPMEDVTSDFDVIKRIDADLRRDAHCAIEQTLRAAPHQRATSTARHAFRIARGSELSGGQSRALRLAGGGAARRRHL